MASGTITAREGVQWARRHWSATTEGVDESPWRSLPPASRTKTEVPLDVQASGISPDEVRRLHDPGSAPIVIRGAAQDWTATKTWSLDWFAENYGDHVVPTDNRDDNGKLIVLPLRDCVERTRAGVTGGYTRFSPLMLEHPELADDLDLEAIGALSGAPLKQLLFQLFIGGANTSTETHCAIGNNAFVQVHGEKIWRFVAPQYSAALQPLPTGRPYFASAATLHDEQLPTHPDAPVHDVHLHAGDLLLVPPFWWHQVDNPTESVGVAGRWHHLNHAFQQSVFMTLMTLTARNPNVVKANKDRRRFGFIYQETVDQAQRSLTRS